MKSAIASSAASSWSSVRRRCSAGSASIERGPVVLGRGSPRTRSATEQNASTTAGSNCLPRLARATSTAASMPGAMVDLDGVGEMEQPHRQRDVLAADSPGTPLPSQRANTWCSGTHTSAPSPNRSAIRDVVRQCDIRPRWTALPPVTTRLAPSASGAAPGSRPDVAEHEPEHRQPGEVDLVAVGPERDVVAEQRRHLRRVRDAAHPRQGDDVVQGAAVVGLDAHVLAERAAMPHDRSTWSIGWPSPRSVASEKAATSSASRTPDSRSPTSTGNSVGVGRRVVLGRRCAGHPWTTRSILVRSSAGALYGTARIVAYFQQVNARLGPRTRNRTQRLTRGGNGSGPPPTPTWPPRHARRPYGRHDRGAAAHS